MIEVRFVLASLLCLAKQAIVRTGIGFVHFLSISTAVRCVEELREDEDWQAEGKRKVNFGKDRCECILLPAQT